MQPERMRVFLACEELVDEIDRLAPAVASGDRNAADHLVRSAESVLFNTGEGIEAWKPKVKISRYEIARREANEIRAILRRLVRRGTLTSQQTARAYALAGAIIGMLTNACITLEQTDR